MSYQLNKTDGTLLTDLIDGQIDNSSTNLVLVGRNYSGYGEYFNENFIKLLESFANTAAPSNPLTGQVWWDVTDQRLKVYDGSAWKASGGPFVQSSRPQMVAGDLWIDNLNNQLYAFDGEDTILIGPQYTATQGKSGFEIGSLLDLQSRSRTVAYLYIGGILSGIFSNIEFTPIYAQRITGLITATNPNGTIFEGFNIINKDTFKYLGIATGANALVTGTGAIRTADQFLPSDSNGITVGTLTVQNSGGLTIGLSQNNVQKVVGPRFYIENQLTDHDLSLRVKSSAYGSVTVDGIYIDASAGKVGIFTTNRLPEYTLDVNGDLRITGNLLVEGETTSIDVATLRVEDKNIEIAKTAAGATLTGLNADNAGLILDTSDSGQKLWTWKQIPNAWTSNVHTNISDTTKSFMIGGVVKLSNTTLEETVINSNLENLGTLTELQVDEINVNSKTISSTNDLRIVSNAGISITGNGDINVTDNQKITGVKTANSARAAIVNPSLTEDTDDTVATKGYVDSEISTEPIVFSMDITGLGAGSTLQSSVASYLNDLYPPVLANNTKIARIHATSYAGATVSGVNVEAIKNLSVIAVDSNGTQNESVVQDIAFDAGGASGLVQLTPLRSLMTYKSSGTTWVYQSTVAY